MIDQTLNDRYHVTALIGEGAMGEVYRATDTQTGQEVAVKVITQKLAFDDDMLARFRREGEALRQLRHSNIVAFVDTFSVGKQQAIVMEYVPGGSLHSLIKQGPLPIDQAVRLTLELSDALSRAHLLNIIHRDLKPENVLLDLGGSPKLTDFGVARLVGETSHLTSTGTQLGTPYYMSPEAWEGKKLDEQADIWSLGVVLFEMLAGQLPFTGDTLVAVMNRVLTTAPPDLRNLRPDVPPALVKIIQRMLARDKAKRYSSMREVALDLERVRKDLAARATPVPPPAKKEAAKPAARPALTPPPAKPATKPPTPRPVAPAQAAQAAPPAPAPAMEAETPTMLAPAAEPAGDIAATVLATPSPAASPFEVPTVVASKPAAVETALKPREARPARRLTPLLIGAGILGVLLVVGLVAAVVVGGLLVANGANSRATQTAAVARLGGTETALAVALAATVPSSTPLPPPTQAPISVPPTVPAAPTSAPPASTAAGPVTPVTIHWFIGLGTGSDASQVPVEQAVVNDFNASQSAIRLDMEVVPSSSAVDTLLSRIRNNNVPDIIGPVGWAGSNALDGQWLDLAPLEQAANFDMSDFDPTLAGMYQTKDGTVGVPFAVYPSVMFYNTQLFDKARLSYPPARYGDLYQLPDGTTAPWTWDTVARVARLLTLDRNGRHSGQAGFDKSSLAQIGYTWQFESQATYVGAYFGSGANGAQTSSALLAPGGAPGSYQANIPDVWRAAWTWTYDGMWGDQPFIESGPVRNLPAFNSGNIFDSGKVAMTVDPIWYICCMPDVKTWDLAAMPSFNGVVGGRLDADTFRIWKGTGHPQEAFTVLQYLTGPAVQKLIVGTDTTPPPYGAVPGRTSFQQAYLTFKHGQFPWVKHWDLITAGLAYIDRPSAEGWMPNYNDAWARQQAFWQLMNSQQGLNLNAEIDRMAKDLTAIFNK